MADISNHLSATAAENVTKWLNEPKYAEYKAEVEALIESENWDALEDAFYTTIEFGTGGIRGTTGLGSSRINKVTIGSAAQALAEYAKETIDDASNRGIVIACDTRLTSDEFSRYCAEVIAANGVKAYIYDSFRSTPQLSFTVRELQCAAGIVISASHNPPADNGFKAYWSDGGQLVAPHDKAVVAASNAVAKINRLPFDEGVNQGIINFVDSSLDKKYIDAVCLEAVGTARELVIAYSPLHGAGQKNTLPVLKQAGFDVKTVTSQMTPDGNFPTVENGKPNPEEVAANDRVVAEMLATQADIAITNDPDADRIGVMVREGDEPIYLNGNQTAALATHYALMKLKESNLLSNKHYVAKTIVTTDLMTAIADDFGVRTYGDMLIGFKYIGRLLRDLEGNDETFVIGGEESYGLLKGEYARDKDGAVGALILSEYAAELKQEQKTLFDGLIDIYKKYGLYLERLDTIYCVGAKGFKQMQDMMERLRTAPPKHVAHHDVTGISDYQTLTRKDVMSGNESKLRCPDTGNVIVLEFGDARRRITIRPSGTEPKIKLYVQWHETLPDVVSNQSVRDRMEQLDNELESLSRTLEGILLDE